MPPWHKRLKNPKRSVPFLIFCACLVALLCRSGLTAPAFQKPKGAPPPQSVFYYNKPTILARLTSPYLTESSGLAASQRSNDIYWTHNDSGDGPSIYAFDAKGRIRAIFRVSGAEADDWEDIAVGPGPKGEPSLYVGDIGDNESSRKEIVVYRIAEPRLDVEVLTVNKQTAPATAPAERIVLHYPDGKHDAEVLLVHPRTGDIYIVTKVLFANPVVYKASAPFTSNRPITLQRLAEVNLHNLFSAVTGGAISPDGQRLALCDYFQGYEFSLPPGSNFDDIWKQQVSTVDLGKRKQGEAITYSRDGRALLATSEGKNPPLIEALRK